ncbi:MAG: hypothetical protein LBL62_04245 [Planctomycetaceae bacterium]|nr:hypothetical protein [Planctomycetaceae bacterium]
MPIRFALFFQDEILFKVNKRLLPHKLYCVISEIGIFEVLVTVLAFLQNPVKSVAV